MLCFSCKSLNFKNSLKNCLRCSKSCNMKSISVICENCSESDMQCEACLKRMRRQKKPSTGICKSCGG